MLITRGKAKRMVRATIKSHPTNVNPMRGPACVWTGEDGTHCVISQSFVDVGLKVPLFNQEHNTDSVGSVIGKKYWDGEARFTKRAISFLLSVQRQADDKTFMARCDGEPEVAEWAKIPGMP